VGRFPLAARISIRGCDEVISEVPRRPVRKLVDRHITVQMQQPMPWDVRRVCVPWCRVQRRLATKTVNLERKSMRIKTTSYIQSRS